MNANSFVRVCICGRAIWCLEWRSQFRLFRSKKKNMETRSCGTASPLQHSSNLSFFLLFSAPTPSINRRICKYAVIHSIEEASVLRVIEMFSNWIEQFNHQSKSVVFRLAHKQIRIGQQKLHTKMKFICRNSSSNSMA